MNTGDAGRIAFLTAFSRNASLWISCYISPIRALLHPLWSCLLLGTLAAAMFGGFRSGIGAVGVILLVGIYYRSGGLGLIVASLGGTAGLALLAMVNLFSPLPPNVQRTLTFLPGTWEQRYKDDAAGSTDWRVEIWKEALTSERWIRNKTLGDGLGFSSADLAKSFTLKRAGATSGIDLMREQVLINGDYHSAIVSTIRTCGYLGLLVFILATVRLAVRAHRLIVRHRNDAWFPLCLFVGIPLVTGPIWLLTNASNFGQMAGTFILGAAMVRLLENNIPVAIANPLPAPAMQTPILSRQRGTLAASS